MSAHNRSQRRLVDMLNFFDYHIMLTRMFGYMLIGDHRRPLKLYHKAAFPLFIFNFVFCVITLPFNTINAVLHGVRFTEVIENNLHSLFAFTAFGKLLWMLWHRNSIAKTKRTLDAAFPLQFEGCSCEVGPLKPEQLIAKYNRRFNIFIKPFAIYMMVGNLLFCCNGLIQMATTYARSGEIVRALPYNMSYPFSMDPTPVFVFVQMQQIFSGVSISNTTMACDLLAFSSVLYYCMHFDMIRLRLRHLTDAERRSSGDDGVQQQSRSGVKSIEWHNRGAFIRILRHHQNVLSINDIINESLGYGIFINYFGSILMLCTLGILIVKNVDYLIVFRMVLYVAFELTQNFIICTLGTILIRNSSDVGNEVYNQLDWTNYTVRSQKMILIILMRTQKESRISALLIKVINYEAFLFIMTSASQFYALMISIL